MSVTSSLSKPKLLAFVAAALLSLMLALCCAPSAYGADSELQAASTQQATISTQAKAKKVWVISKSAYNKFDEYSTTYTYNKNGLISKKTALAMTNATDSSWVQSTQYYKYNSKGLLTKTWRNDSKAPSTTYKYNSKGQLTKRTVTRYDYNSKRMKSEVTTYEYDAKGRVKCAKEGFSSHSMSTGDKSYSFYKWYYPSYNSKGLISGVKTANMYRSKGKWVRYNSDVGYSPVDYSYDAKGNLTKVTSDKGTPNASSTQYKNSYNKQSKLSKCKSPWSSQLYRYKQVSVPTAFSSAVAKQQRELVNPSPTNLVWY